MTLRQNNGEGYANGTPVATGQTLAGSAWDQVSTATGGATAVYDTSNFMHGSASYHFTGAATSTIYARWNGSNDQTMAIRFYLRLNATPGAQDILQVYSTSNVTVGGVGLSATGQLVVKSATGGNLKTFTALTLNTWYRVEMQVNVGTGTSDGTCNVAYYAGDSSTVVEAAYAGTAVNMGGVNTSYVRIGKNTSSPTLDMNVDDFAINNGTTTPIGPTAAPPTAAFSSTSSGLTVNFNASASVDSSGNPVASYAWQFGDGSTGTGVTPSHTYTAGGAQTVTLTVTDSGGATGSVTGTVMPAAPQSTVVPNGFTGAGWTAVGTDAVTAISDANPSSYVVSPAGGGTETENLPAITPPTSGTDMTVTKEADRIGSSTGTISVALYEGSTLRASGAQQALPAGVTNSAMASTLTFTLPAASIANVGNWNSGLTLVWTTNVS